MQALSLRQKAPGVVFVRSPDKNKGSVPPSVGPSPSSASMAVYGHFSDDASEVDEAVVGAILWHRQPRCFEQAFTVRPVRIDAL